MEGSHSTRRVNLANPCKYLRGWESGMPQLYGFDGIPFTVLVNPEGKLIAKGLRGEALASTIESFYTKAQ